jgi:hypothetical protein
MDDTDTWCDKCDQFASFRPCQTCGWWYCDECCARTNADYCPSCGYGPIVWTSGPIISYGAGAVGSPILQWMKDNLPDAEFRNRDAN